MPLAFNPAFPVYTLTPMRGATGLQMRRPERFEAYVQAVFTALAADPAVKAALVAATDEAVARGVFGAPSCFVATPMFFVQDRLDFVRDAAAG